MDFGNYIFAAVCLIFCTPTLGLMAFWAFTRKDPMHFRAGSEVKPEEITDIKAYNRANGIMWLIYTAGFVLTGVLSLFRLTAWLAPIMITLLSTVGIIVMLIVYKRIYKKYKRR